MTQNIFLICVIILILQFLCHAYELSTNQLVFAIFTHQRFCPVTILLGSPGSCFFFVIPEDVAMAFTTYFGFAPPIYQGNDHRVGFGFRFGNHADLQILYEFGPQTSTIPLRSIKVRSTPRREVRRPFIELLLRTGILRRGSFHHDMDNDDDE